MRKIGWWMATGALALAGCAHEAKPLDPQRQVISDAQQRSEKAFSEAAVAQRDARAAQDRAARAQDDVVDARRRLTDAESRARTAQQQARSAQETAAQRAETAEAQARAAQRRAIEAQKRFEQDQATQSETFHRARLMATQETVIQGATVVSASRKLVVVREPGRGPLSLNIGERAQAFFDGKPVAVDQVPEGSEARVSYELVDGQPMLLKLEANLNGSHGQPVAP